MPLSPKQLHYLDALIDQPQEELLFEIASGMVSGITASAEPKYETKAAGPSREEQIMAELQRLKVRVPDGPISKHQKPFLTTFLDNARKTVEEARARVYQALCNTETQQPTAKAVEMMTGSEKDVIAAVAMLLFERYSTMISVAIPVSIYLCRKGLHSFCAVNPIK